VNTTWPSSAFTRGCDIEADAAAPAGCHTPRRTRVILAAAGKSLIVVGCAGNPP